MTSCVNIHGMSFVYVIGIEGRENVVKIGYSADPAKRLCQLQTGHERPLTLVYTEEVQDHRAPVLEKLVHQAQRHNRLRGEWFNLTYEQAILELKFAVIRYEDQD